jgi:hypothetical protein
MSVTTITVPTLDGKSVDISISSIQFFWQKLLDRRTRQCITQIVYNTMDTLPEDISYNCHLLGASMVIPAVPLRFVKPIPNRAAVDTLYSLDGFRSLLVHINPDVKCIELHREFTRGDDRVFALHRSAFVTKLLQKAKDFLSQPNEELSDYYKRETGRRCSLSGDGDLDGIPMWWTATAGCSRIILTDTAEDTIQKIESALSEN